jgi:hypothetical protein
MELAPQLGLTGDDVALVVERDAHGRAVPRRLGLPDTLVFEHGAGDIGVASPRQVVPSPGPQ